MNTVESAEGAVAAGAQAEPPANAALKLVVSFGRLVRFSHTVFALPFAMAAFALATLEAPFRWEALAWILVAMVSARSAAMGFNRLVDRRIDGANPRTAHRELPRGLIPLGAAWAFVAACSAVFVAAAWMLNPACGLLSPAALAILFFYSLTKRFTSASQFFLGLSLAISPVGAWLAQTGYIDWRILVLAAAVLLWVSGFDVFYACLDFEFDLEQGLRSIPVKLGLRGAIALARLLHLGAAVLLVSLYWLYPFGPAYLAGAATVVILLFVEDLMVDHKNLSRVMAAFNLNGAVSIIFFLSVLAGIAWR